MMNEPPEEAVRWRWDRRVFRTPEEHDERLTDEAPWLSRGRNHRTRSEGGIERQVRDDEEFVEVLDEHGDLLGDLVVGRTIIAIERESSTDEAFPQGANDVTITLNNGTRLHFTGWGYDASGLYTSIAPPALPDDVD